MASDGAKTQQEADNMQNENQTMTVEFDSGIYTASAVKKAARDFSKAASITVEISEKKIRAIFTNIIYPDTKELADEFANYIIHKTASTSL